MNRVVLAGTAVSILLLCGAALLFQNLSDPVPQAPIRRIPREDFKPSPLTLAEPSIARDSGPAETRDYPSPDKCIVLNEIQYHPQGGSEKDEWIELFNRGKIPVDLGGWKISGDVEFEFPSGAAIPSGEYLVVSADKDRLRAALGIGNVAGNWTGRLKRGSGTVRILGKDGQEILAISYGDLPPFPALADGHGSSLELRNPHGDPAFPGNWGPSTSSGWTRFRVEGAATSSRLYLYLLGAGTVFVDDLTIRPLGGSAGPFAGQGGGSGAGDVAQNGGFEDGPSPWTFNGNHSGSKITSETPRSGRRCLKIVASGPGSSQMTSVCSYHPRLVSGQSYAIEFWARFTEPPVPLVVRLSNSRKDARSLSVEARPLGSTPGRVNSLYTTTIPPFIFPVTRSIEKPAPGDEVTIQATVFCSAKLRSVVLYLDDGKRERAIPLQEEAAPERDPAAAGKSIYSARIGPFSEGSLVSYHVAAEDEAGGKGRFPFEGNPTKKIGFYVSGKKEETGLPAYRLFLPRASLQELERNPYSDAYQTGAFVFGGRAWFDVGIRYRGQTSRWCPKHSWKVKFNDDDPFEIPGTCGRGVAGSINLNSSYSDKSYLRELLSYRLFRDLGEPCCETFPVRLILNGSYHGLFLHLENPGSPFLKRNGLEEGWLWKSYSNARGNSGGGSGYFELKAGDPGEAGAKLEEFLAKINSLSGASLEEYIRGHMDVDSTIDYLAACQLIHNADPVEKNYLLHCDRAGRFRLLPWDLDLTHGRNYECQSGGVLNDVIRHDMWDGDFRDDALLFGTRYHPKCDRHVNGIIDAFLGRIAAFRGAYYERLAQGLSRLYHPDVLIPKVERLFDEIREEARRDREVWPAYGDDSEAERHVEALKTWVRRRYEHLRGKLEGLGYRVEEALNADFEPASAACGSAPLTVTFRNLSAGKIASYLWDFGDGEKSAEREPTVVFSSPGWRSVSLQVTGTDGRKHLAARRRLIHVARGSEAVTLQAERIRP